MKGWFVNVALLEDRFILILFKLFKIGIINTSQTGSNGVSIVLGIWRIESQFNISLIKKIIINEKDYGHA